MFSSIRTWIRVSRSNFLFSSLLPYCLGAALAPGLNNYGVGIFLAGLAISLLVHLAANLFNEYWDYRFEADSSQEKYLPHFGGSKAIQTGMVTPKAVHRAAWLCLLGANLLGLVITFATKDPIPLAFILGGSFIAWAYTAPPLRFAYRGWGEISLLVAFGPLLVLGGYYLQTQQLAGEAILISLSPGFLIAALLIANEFGDTAGDAKVGKRNLVVRIGMKKGLGAYRFCLIACYLPPVFMGLFGHNSLYLLFPVLSIPLAWRSSKTLAEAIKTGGGFAPSSKQAVGLYLVFHLLFITGGFCR